jgi:hypothetical protein
MPDSPRPAIAFPAFQTPAGLTPQADREHRSDYAETQGQAKELNRRTSGVWLDLPYSPDRYRAEPPAIWTVTPSDILTARYKVIGATLTMSLFVFGSINSPASILHVQLPERLRARQYAHAPAQVSSLAIPNFAVNVCQIAPGSRALGFFWLQFAAWPVGGVRIGTQIEIEVEEV